MPQHMRFALVLNQRIEMRLVVPLALSVLLSGAGLIWSADIDFFHSPFLIVAVALYLVAVGIALGGLVPATERLVHLTENMPSPPPVGAPPTEVMSLIGRSRRLGALLGVLFLVIIFLMIVQPAGSHSAAEQ